MPHTGPIAWCVGTLGYVVEGGLRPSTKDNQQRRQFWIRCKGMALETRESSSLTDTSYPIVVQPDERRSSTVFSSTSARCTIPEAVGRRPGTNSLGVGPRALRRAYPHWDMSLKEAFDLLPKTTSKGDNFGFGAKVWRWRRERKAPR